MILRTTSAAQTRALAAALAELLEAGDVVVLAGELGSGKTTFAQGLAAGLGVQAPVTSPTFTIVQEYEGRLPMAHVDVYRLDRVQEVHDLGLEEMVDGDGVTVVEWGDRVAQVLPDAHLVVALSMPAGPHGAGAAPDDRELALQFRGSGWQARRPAVERALAAYGGAGAGSA